MKNSSGNFPNPNDITDELRNNARWLGIYSVVVAALFAVLGWNLLKEVNASKYLGYVLWFIALIPLAKTWAYFSVASPNAFWAIQNVFSQRS